MDENKGHMLSCFGPVQLFATLWTVAPYTPLSMGFSGQEYFMLFMLSFKKITKCTSAF